MIDFVAVAKITGNAERTQNYGDEKYGGVEEKAETMPITLGSEVGKYEEN